MQSEGQKTNRRDMYLLLIESVGGERLYLNRNIQWDWDDIGIQSHKREKRKDCNLYSTQICKKLWMCLKRTWTSQNSLHKNLYFRMQNLCMISSGHISSRHVEQEVHYEWRILQETCSLDHTAPQYLEVWDPDTNTECL
jgi:hypothetical protein